MGAAPSTGDSLFVDCCQERSSAVTEASACAHATVEENDSAKPEDPSIRTNEKAEQDPSKAPNDLRARLLDILVSGLLGFLGIGAVSLLHFGITDESDYTLILGSFGASAILLYGAPSVPFSQPRNCIGGHIISCLIGVACYELIANPMESVWLCLPVATSLAMMAMQLTNTVHPPAGGTVLIAVLGSDRMHNLGFRLLIPTGIGAVLLVLVAMGNNLIPARKKYPTKWL